VECQLCSEKCGVCSVECRCEMFNVVLESVEGRVGRVESRLEHHQVLPMPRKMARKT